MKIGLISDTHSYVDSRVFEYFKDCDEVWHAGDIGDRETADAFNEFKRFRAVYGNIDPPELQHRFPEDLRFTCAGLSVWITHIGGTPPNYNPRIKKLLRTDPPDIFICGHSHILRIKKDPAFGNLLYLNPGAAGNHGFHTVKTLLRFTIEEKNIRDMEVIELGKRGAIDPSEAIR